MQHNLALSTLLLTPAGGYLIGDAAHQLSPWLLLPYKQTSKQSHMSTFNTAHTRKWVEIQRDFGLRKTLFQRLLHVDMASIGFTVDIVLAACVHQNIVARAADTMDEEDVELNTAADASSLVLLQKQETTGQVAALRDNIGWSL
ncbi:hypothetical protein HPB48_021519 [Haemaphysalis longicornis]|uniref:DDE Tnp4 domain-containing protein n=1 Tax=Haemaphysalis longicornis TaxID=44386 RepID=A0A9J6GW46_HAELO|nr:hypothetical protein HPB48_021519 [Haemaphysalis longicornis]